MTKFIIFAIAPHLAHIRKDETFTHCGCWLTPPKEFKELDAIPDGVKECGSCRVGLKKTETA